jgi:histidinol-phosphate aminotransferase
VAGTRGSDFELSPDEVASIASIHAPDVLFLCSPNNPTGGVDRPSVVIAALDRTPGLVAVDEAYGQFADWSALSLLDDERPLVVIRTFSKTWAMAGARLGYLVGPAWVVDELHKVVLPYHLDVMKQAAGRLALRYESDMRARVEEIVAERERLAQAMRPLVLTQWPSQANFILFRPEASDAETVWQGLLDRSVLVRNCASWPGLRGCLRVTVGTPHENDTFVSALKEILS